MTATNVFIEIVDSALLWVQYPDRTWHLDDMGKTVFLILRDKKSYVALFIDHESYVTYFNREASPAGAAYSGFREPRIIGVDSMLDQKDLEEILYDYLPTDEYPRGKVFQETK